MARLQTQRPTAYAILGNSSFWGWYNYALTNKVWTGWHVMGGGDTQSRIAEAYIIRDGVTLPNNRASSNQTGITNGSTMTVSGTPAEWGFAGATGADIKSANLGFQFAFKAMQYPAYTVEQLRTASIQLYGMNLSFIPDDLAVTSLSFSVVCELWPTGGGTYAVVVTDAYMTINATIVLKMSASSEMRGLMTLGYKELSNIDTEIIYEANTKDGDFLGRIQTPTTQFSLQTELDTIHSKLGISFGQNDETQETVLTQITTEIAENMLTELGYGIVGGLSVPVGLGEDTTVDTNVSMNVTARYGDWMPWLTEDGKYITTEDNKIIVGQYGYPDGRSIFKGYISEWTLRAGKTGAVDATILSNSQELNNIAVETEPIPAYSYLGGTGTRKGIGGYGNNLTQAIAQVIPVSGGSKYVSGIMLYGVSIPGGRIEGQFNSATIAVDIYSGVADFQEATYMTTGTLSLPVGREYGTVFVPFASPVRLISGLSFTAVIQVRGGTKDTTDPYKMYLNVDAAGGYSGQSYERLNDEGNPFQTRSWDLQFMFYEQSGLLQRTFYSVDPSVMLMTIADFAKARGAKVNYDASTIELTNTAVTLLINTNSVSEAFDSIAKSMPADWHIWYDPGSDTLHAHPRPTEVTQLFKRGINVVGEPTLTKSIENITNDVIFSGGQLDTDNDGQADTNLLVRVQDPQSITTYRRGLLKLSDSRYKDAASARLVAQNEIDRNSAPQYSGNVMVVQTENRSLLDVLPGELGQYSGFSTVMDTPELQIVGITYEIERSIYKLNVLKKRTPQRIEDLKRNMANLEAENNPTAPA